MTLAEAERQGVAAQNEGIDRKEQAIQGVIDGAFKIATELTQAISNNATNKAYAKMQEEYAIYSASGEALKNADGSPANVEQVKANYDNWVENKLNEINPLIRGNVRKSWNSNRGTHMGNLAAKSIEYANAQRQQSANESYTRAMTASFEGQSVQEQVSMITAGGDYDLEGMLSFLPGDTWQEKLSSAGLDNDVGLKMIQYGTDLTRLGYSPYDVSNSLKNARNSFVMSSVEQTVIGDYLSELKTTGNEAAFWKSTQEFLAGDIPGMDRRLTVDEQAAYIKRFKELASVDKAALIEQNNNAYSSFTSAIQAYANSGGIPDSLYLENIIEETGVNKNLLTIEQRQIIDNIGTRNDFISDMKPLVERLNNAGSISEQQAILNEYMSGLDSTELYKFKTLNFYTVENTNVKIRTWMEFVDANVETGGLKTKSLSNDEALIAKSIENETSKAIDAIYAKAVNAAADGNAISLEEFDSELEEAGISKDDPEIADKRKNVAEWRKTSIGASISSVYSNLSQDIAEGKVEMDYTTEFLARLKAAGIDIEAESSRALYQDKFQSLSRMQEQKIESDNLEMFSEHLKELCNWKYASKNPEHLIGMEMAIAFNKRNELYDKYIDMENELKEKYGAYMRTELRQEGNSEILKRLAEEEGIDPTGLGLENMSIAEGIRTISSEYASIYGENAMTKANSLFDTYGKKGATGENSKTFNEYYAEIESTLNATQPTTNGEKRTITDPSSQAQYSRDVKTIEAQILLGKITDADARAKILNSNFFQDDKVRLTSLIDGQYATKLKELNIDLNGMKTDTLKKFGYEGNVEMEEFADSVIVGFFNRDGNMNKLLTGQTSPDEIKKALTEGIGKVAIAPLFNKTDAAKLNDILKEDGYTKYSSSLSDIVQEGATEIMNGGKSEPNPLARKKAIEFSLDPNNELLEMQIVGSNVGKKTEGVNTVSKKDQSLMAIAAGLRANGFPVEYDPYGKDKAKQEELMMMTFTALDDTTKQIVADTGSYILARTNKAKEIETYSSEPVEIDANGNYWIGENSISSENTGFGNELIATTPDKERIRLEKVNEKSIKELAKSLHMDFLDTLAYSSSIGDNHIEYTPENVLNYINNDKRLIQMISDYKKLYPNMDVQINYVNNRKIDVVIKEIK